MLFWVFPADPRDAGWIQIFNSIHSCTTTIQVHYNSGQGLTLITVNLSPCKKKKKCFAKLLDPSSRMCFSELPAQTCHLNAGKSQLSSPVSCYISNNLANSPVKRVNKWLTFTSTQFTITLFSKPLRQEIDSATSWFIFALTFRSELRELKVSCSMPSHMWLMS